MSEKESSELYIFGRGKVNLRQLVIFNCQAKAKDREADAVLVSRAYRDREGKVSLEDSNMKAVLLVETKSVHLSGIFLSENFGLSLRLNDSAGGSFLLSKRKEDHPLIEVRTPQGDEVHILSYAEGTAVT